jgi:hypothetical protein
LLNQCSSVRLYLNTEVKRVSYHEKKPGSMNKLSYSRKPRTETNQTLKGIEKSYDYIVITFPLVKGAEKSQNHFELDILYRDFMNCELFFTYSYIIQGILSRTFLDDFNLKNKEPVNIHTMDPQFKFQSIRTLKPMSQKTQKGSHLFAINTVHKELSEATLDTVFEPGYKIVDKKLINLGPLNKKFQYSHTIFPQIILDGKRRSRIFYLNSLEWLESSKEMSIISARNIALMISKKELGSSVVMKNNSCEKLSRSGEQDDIRLCTNKTRVKNITYFSLLTTLSFYIFIKRAKSIFE